MKLLRGTSTRTCRLRTRARTSALSGIQANDRYWDKGDSAPANLEMIARDHRDVVARPHAGLGPAERTRLFPGVHFYKT